MKLLDAGPRNQRVDVIRGVSILLVLLHHFNIAYVLRDTTLAAVFGWDAVRAVVRNGNYGVTMFFTISGYLITTNARRRWGALRDVEPLAFYGLRAARIVPCLLALLIVVNGLASTGVEIFQNRASNGVPMSFWIVNAASLTFWMNVLITACGWINYPLGVLWSLSVEEVFYLSFPLACLALRRESRLLLFLGCLVALGPWYRATHQGEADGFLYGYLACFDGIAIGCAAAILAEKIPGRRLATPMAQGAVVAMMLFVYLGEPIGQNNVWGVTAMALGTAVLILASRGATAAGVRRGRGMGRGVAWLGRLSYELYLFHLVVLGALRTAFPPRAMAGDGKLLLLAAYLVLATALGGLVARLYADPLNRGIRRRLTAMRVLPEA